MMAKAAKTTAKKKPAKKKPPTFDITVPLQEVINDLTARIGDAGTVEDRQRTIDRLQALVGLCQASAD